MPESACRCGAPSLSFHPTADGMRLLDPIAGPDKPEFASRGQCGAVGGRSPAAAFRLLGTWAAEEGRGAAALARHPAGLAGRSRAPSMRGRRGALDSVRERQWRRRAGGCGAATRARPCVGQPVAIARCMYVASVDRGRVYICLRHYHTCNDRTFHIHTHSGRLVAHCHAPRVRALPNSPPLLSTAAITIE